VRRCAPWSPTETRDPDGTGYSRKLPSSGKLTLDGGQHFNSAAQKCDQRRTTFLLRHGVRVLRFPTDLVFREPIAVLDAIILALGGGPSP